MVSYITMSPARCDLVLVVILAHILVSAIVTVASVRRAFLMAYIPTIGGLPQKLS